MTGQKGSRRFREDNELKKPHGCRFLAQYRQYVPYTVVSRAGDGGRGDGPRQTPGPAEVVEIRRMNIVVPLHFRVISSVASLQRTHVTSTVSPERRLREEAPASSGRARREDGKSYRSKSPRAPSLDRGVCGCKGTKITLVCVPQAHLWESAGAGHDHRRRISVHDGR